MNTLLSSEVQQEKFATVSIVHNESLPDDSITIFQDAFSSLGDRRIVQIVRIERKNIANFIAILQSL